MINDKNSIHYLFFYRKGPDLLDLILNAHINQKSNQFNDEELYQEALTFGLFKR